VAAAHAVSDAKEEARETARQEEAAANAGVAYARSLIPQEADLAEIRRQRMRQFALSRSSSGASGVLGAPAGGKTALGL
jgi:hypothetical protein